MNELPLEQQMREELEEEREEQRRVAEVINQEHKGYYRRCFSSTDGKKVLAHMLFSLGYFSEDGPIELKNYAARLMSTLGFTDSFDRIEFFVDKCFEIQQTERKHDDKV